MTQQLKAETIINLWSAKGIMRIQLERYLKRNNISLHQYINLICFNKNRKEKQ
tara:strand:- start:4576 stop:4734 length:159 start_codon:yes stop_codon:yes gene_type:complete